MKPCTLFGLVLFLSRAMAVPVSPFEGRLSCEGCRVGIFSGGDACCAALVRRWLASLPAAAASQLTARSPPRHQCFVTGSFAGGYCDEEK